MFMLFLLTAAVISSCSAARWARLARAARNTRIALVVVDRDGGKSAQTLLEKLDRAGSVRAELQEENRR